MRPAALILTFLLMPGWTTVSALDNEGLWKEAADSYDNGDYEAAAERYNKIAERGFVSAELYYNLGNSYFKAGQLAESIRAYRRALRLEPDFEKAKSNLSYVRALNVDQIEGGKGGFILDIWEFLSGLLAANGYLAILAVAWWIAGTLTIFMILWPDRIPAVHYLLILCLIVAIFSGASAVNRIKEDRLTTWGVISARAADIREGPGSDFERIEIGHEGLEFKILGERENSYLIELGNGLKGWLDKKAALVI
jgi:tetratricopeptide (TPR) repeat protein